MFVCVCVCVAERERERPFMSRDAIDRTTSVIDRTTSVVTLPKVNTKSDPKHFCV